MTLTQTRLQELLHYDPEIGVFTWVNSSRYGWNGKVAGCVFKPGVRNTAYLRIVVDGKPYLAHRLAWLYVHGEFPAGLLDHKDLDGCNNRIKNLRRATHSQNICNAKTKINNTSGVKNVYWHDVMHKWCGKFRLHKRWVPVGYFHSIEDAAEAVRLKRIELHGDFANHN